MKKKVYIIKEEIKSFDCKILKDDIIGMDAYILDKKIGFVNDIYNTGVNYEVFEIFDNNRNKVLIPYHKDFIESIDLKNKRIIFKGGLFDA